MLLPPLSTMMMNHSLPVVETWGPQLIHMWIARLHNCLSTLITTYVEHIQWGFIGCGTKMGQYQDCQ